MDESQLTLAILDSMPSHIAVLDRQGTIVAVNEAWRRFARDKVCAGGCLPRHTDIGANYLEVCEASGADGADGVRGIGEAIRAVLNGQLATYSAEYPCHSPDEQRWFLMTVTPLSLASGGAVINHTTITERRKMEHLLKREHALACAAIDSAPGIFLKFDAKGRMLRWNRNLEQVAGWDAQRIASMHALEFFSPSEHALAHAAMESVLVAGEGVFDLLLRTRGGDNIAFMLNARRVELDGKPVIICFGVDVTRQKRATEELAHYQRELEVMVSKRTEELASANLQLVAREKLTRTIADNIPGMIGYWGRDLRCRFANRAYTDWFGRTPEQMVGLSVMDAIGAEVFERNRSRMEAVLRGEAQEFFNAIKKPSGQMGYIWAHYIPDHDDGDVVGFYALAMDVTKQKEAENALAESQSQLRLLLERAESAREQERQALARDVHDDLGQLLTGMHLTISALQMRQRRTKAHVDQVIAELMEQIDQTQLVVRRVANKLSPARLQSGLLPAIESLALDLRSKTGMSCHLSIQGDAPRLDHAVTTAIYRMVQEALTNIARHSGASQVVICLASDGGTLHLVVSDDGVGFDMNAVNHSGDSLGLMGMRERALIIQATLNIDSAPRKGTRIEVHIPIESEGGQS